MQHGITVKTKEVFAVIFITEKAHRSRNNGNFELLYYEMI